MEYTRRHNDPQTKEDEDVDVDVDVDVDGDVDADGVKDMLKINETGWRKP